MTTQTTNTPQRRNTLMKLTKSIHYLQLAKQAMTTKQFLKYGLRISEIQEEILKDNK